MTQTQTSKKTHYEIAARAARMDVKMYEAKCEKLRAELEECERMAAMWATTAQDWQNLADAS